MNKCQQLQRNVNKRSYHVPEYFDGTKTLVKYTLIFFVLFCFFLYFRIAEHVLCNPENWKGDLKEVNY